MKILVRYFKQKNVFSIVSFGMLLILLFTHTIVISQIPPASNCACVNCNYPCGSGHASSCKYYNSPTTVTIPQQGTSFSKNWQAFKKTRQAQRVVTGLQLNDKGIEEYRKKNWAEAIKFYKEALKYIPNDDVIRQNLKNAEDSFSSEKSIAETEKSQREYEDNQRKWKEEQKKKEMDQQLILEKNGKEAIEIKLKDAQQKIYALQKDVSRIQLSLKIYSKSLQNNATEFEKWGTTVDEAYNNVIDNSKGYLTSMFLKYNLLDGLKHEEQKIIFNKLRDLLGNANPELQKWLVLVSKSNVVNLDEVEDIIDRVNLTGDLAVLITGDKNKIKHNLDALLLVNGLIETFNLDGYKDHIKNIAQPFGAENMPGDYYEQAKMIGETYADLTSICYSWFMINKLTTNTEAFADKINLLSFNMQHQMKEIDCLKICIKDYSAGSIEKCTGVTRFSTPPPLLR